MRALFLFARAFQRREAARTCTFVIIQRTRNGQLARLTAIVAGVAARLGFGALGRLDRGEATRRGRSGRGIALILSTIIVVPVLAFFAVVVLRFVIESGVALVAIAENTERTAQNTQPGSRR